MPNAGQLVLAAQWFLEHFSPAHPSGNDSLSRSSLNQIAVMSEVFHVYSELNPFVFNET